MPDRLQAKKSARCLRFQWKALEWPWLPHVGQNYGAGRIDRIKSGIKSGLTIQALYCVFAWTAIFFLKGAFVHLVLGDGSPEVTAMAIQYLTIMSALFIIHGSR